MEEVSTAFTTGREEVLGSGEAVSTQFENNGTSNPPTKKRNRRKERSRKNRAPLLQDEIACIASDFQSVHLDPSPHGAQSSISVAADIPLDSQNIVSAPACSLNVKRKRKKKKSVASPSIEEGKSVDDMSYPVKVDLKQLEDPRLAPKVPGVSKIRSKKKEKTASTFIDGKSNPLLIPPLNLKSLNNGSQQKLGSPSKKQKNRDFQNKTRLQDDQLLNENKFEPHLQRELVDVMLKEQVNVIKGFVRINQRNYREAYISNPDGSKDILIDGVKDRNRALEGDEVVLQILPESQWKELNGEIQKVGKVIHILNQVHDRHAVGTLKKLQDGNARRALFSPRDSRVPRMHIPMNECPKNAKLWEKELYQARLTEWDDVRYAKGQLLDDSIGVQGDIEAETRAILLENEVKSAPYDKKLYSYFPKPPFHISDEHLCGREDLRKLCIFTIDPLTARDLDDAVSCEKLQNGNYRIGVHISDVAFFLTEGTPLDKEVAQRATTTYLVQRAYHMLPPEMTLMCSLLPGQDKLAFSVFWEMTPAAEVISHYFTRSVIHSCAQLSYEHAQIMIDEPDHVWKEAEFPKLHGPWTVEDLTEVVLTLHSLAKTMRKERFDSGALRVNQTKLMFNLNDAGEPLSFSAYVNKESHRLIEEFMLLANMTVATDLQKKFPKIAFLRCHDEPQPDMLKKLAEMLEKLGIMLDTSSAGSLHKSLERYCSHGDAAHSVALNSLCSRPMVRARYFCASAIPEVQHMRHYALNVPLYTHFTSPIRRYADVMVHRLLCGLLGYSEEPKWTIDYVNSIAANCNKMKFCAKKAGEQSTELFLAVWVKNHGTIETEVVVIDVKDRSFDAIVCSTGSNIRVYTDKLAASVEFENSSVPRLNITWTIANGCSQVAHQVVTLFSVVTVALRTSSTNNLKIEASLLPPK